MVGFEPLANRQGFFIFTRNPTAMNTKPVLLLILVGFVYSSCGSGSRIPTDPVMEKDMVKVLGLKGSVLLLEENEYTHGVAEFDSTINSKSSRWIKSRSRQFNANGQLVRDEMKVEKGKQVTEYLLDNYGRYTEINSIADGDGESWYERYSYFDHGKLREKQRFNGNEQLISRETHRYDEKLRDVKVTSRVYNALNGEENDEQKFDFEYSYDLEGDVKVMSSSIGDEPVSRIEYENGKVVKSLVDQGDGVLRPIKTYSYSGDGRLQRIHIWDKSSESYSSEIQDHYYDSRGNLIEKRVMNPIGDREGGRFDYQFDSLGIMISESYWSGHWASSHPEKGKLLDEKLEYHRVYKFEYDSRGNWIKKEVFLNDEISYSTARKFTYR